MNMQYTYLDILYAYLAGTIDSDGCLGIRRKIWHGKQHDTPMYSPRITIKQIQSEAVMLLHDMFGGSIYIQPPYSKGSQSLFALEIKDKAAIRCIRALCPYLRIKRDQARLILQLAEEKEKPRSEVTTPGEKLEVVTRWGTTTRAPRRSLSKETLEKREAIFQEFRIIKASSSNTAKVSQEQLYS